MVLLSIPVKRGLQKLGHNIRNARLKRRITMALMAERASISRTTLTKVEKGDPAVALGIYASVMFVLGLLSNLEQVADPSKDELGLALEEENLPQRIRTPRDVHSKEDEHVH